MNPAVSPLEPWLAQRMGLAELRPEAVEAWQMAALRRTLDWARQASPFLARRLAGLEVESLRSTTDLARLPRMTVADLAEPGLLALSQDEVARVVSLGTSGSSGPAKRLYFSEADLSRTLEFFAVGMSTLAGPGDSVLVLLPGRNDNGVADLLSRALPSLGARAVLPPLPASGTWSLDGLPQLLADEEVTVLVAAPRQLQQVLEHEGAQAACRRALRAVLSSGEPLAPVLRALAEDMLGCEIFDHWGMTETGYGGGVECRAHSGYHLREADLLLEIADPTTGAALPPGELGEILVTTLGQRALPLLRYRSGDAAFWLPGPCACGSRLRRLGCVPGRLGANGQGIVHRVKGRGTT